MLHTYEHAKKAKAPKTTPLQALLEKATAEKFNGVLSLSVDKQSCVKQAIGLNGIFEGNAALDSNAVFLLGSVSKLFTAVAIYKLAEERSLSLDAPISHYLPVEKLPASWQAWMDKVTIEMLLNHTSGLPADLYPLEDTYYLFNRANEEGSLIEHLNRSENNHISADPSVIGREAYSNIGYNLLALIIEHCAKCDYHNYLDKVIFKPLNMQNTFSATASNVSLNKMLDENPQIAKPIYYQILFNGQALSSPKLEFDFDHLTPGADINLVTTIGAGSIFSNADDLIKFVNGLFYTDLVLRAQSSKQLLKNIAWDDEDCLWGHQGYLYGYHANLFHDFEKKNTVIVLSNQDANMPGFNTEVNLKQGADIPCFEVRGGPKGLKHELEAVQEKLYGPLNISLDLFGLHVDKASLNPQTKSKVSLN